MALTGPQQALAETMSDISEFCWFARWLIGTEYRLWRFMTDPNDDEPWGNYPIPPEYRERLQQLSASTGGWIYWRDMADAADDANGPTFIAKADWEAAYDAWRQMQEADTKTAKRLPRRYAEYVDWFAQQAKDNERGDD